MIEAGTVYFSFFAYDAGEYYFTSNDLFVSAVMTEDGTVVEMNENYRYDLESWTSYIVAINASYVYAAGDYTITPSYSYPEGHQNNPFWLTIGEDTVASYAGGYASHVWYQFYANATGTLVITNLSDVDNVVMMITAVFGNEVSNVSYDEEWNAIYADSISLDVIQGRQYYIGISAELAESAVDIKFGTSITEGEIETDGTINVPHFVVIGSNTANVPQYENVWFSYDFESNGTLTLTTDSTNCDWYITKDVNEYTPYVTGGTIEIHGEWGDTVYVFISTTNYEADSINFTASIEADPTEVYYENEVIIDGSAANEIVIAEKTWAALSFRGAGQYIISWDNADAKVELVAWGVDNTVIANGDVITGSNWGTNLIVYLPEYAAGTVNLTITPYVAAAQELTVGENTVSVTDTQFGNEVILAATVDTTYVITAGDNAVVVYDYSNYFPGDSVEITVLAGESVTLNVGTYDWTASDVVVTVDVK